MTDITLNQSQKLTWRSFGPGILMASAAIGGSHLVASTQAGALYGWQLAIMIILANFFKYPFYRFGTEYAYSTGNSLVAGYAKISRIYLWAFFVLCIIASFQALLVQVRWHYCVRPFWGKFCLGNSAL